MFNDKGQQLKNFVIKYRSWEAYNAYTKEEAVELFKRDGHEEEEIEMVDGQEYYDG
jgi:hypothetical protein